jgi:hypothetical protein
MLVLSLMIFAIGNHNVLAAEMKTAKQDGWLLEGRLIDTTDWNSLCNPPEPELLPNSIKMGFIGGSSVSYAECGKNYIADLLNPLILIIKVHNLTENDHTLIFPSPIDVVIHSETFSKPAVALYYTLFIPLGLRWLIYTNVELSTDIKAEASIELLYAIPRFKGEATIQFGEVGSFTIVNDVASSIRSNDKLSIAWGKLRIGDEKK